MDFAFSDEQEELRRTVRAFLDDRSPEAEVRRLMETEEGFDAAVWRVAAEQMGLVGLAIPEEYGGAGYSFVEVGIVLEEMGRALACLPYFSSAVLAAGALLGSDDDEMKKELLPLIASGEKRATLALAEDSGAWDEAVVSLAASRDGAGWRLDGHKSYVVDGHTADVLLVVARSAAGVGLFVVDGAARGLTRTPLNTMDLTRKQARLAFSGTPARLVGADGAGWPAVQHALHLAAVALAAESVGGGQRVLDMAVEYAKVRIQFGRPIGSFQAIKHKCADVLLEVESARSAAYYAMWAAAEAPDELPLMASLAKSYCTDAYFHAAAENIQIHGGIGFTWEHPAHLYFKRAKSSQLLFGDPAYHRELVAQHIGI